MMKNQVVALTCRGWSHVQLREYMKLQKSWIFEGQEYRVDAYFGKLCDGNETPVIIMNVYNQGCGATEVVDDNCDVWRNVFTSTNKEEGNEYYKYLKKHGFVRVA